MFWHFKKVITEIEYVVLELEHVIYHGEITIHETGLFFFLFTKIKNTVKIEKNDLIP